MTILERIVRLFLGVQSRSSPLAELFQDQADATKAIILEETGFPYGGVIKYTWWKSNSSEFFRKMCKGFTQTEPDSDAPVLDLGTKGCVETLSSLIEEFEGPKNYTGNVRDGVVYRVACGTRDRQEVFTISNPPAGSRHYQLVTQIKEHVLK